MKKDLKSLNKKEFEQLKKSGMLWEIYPDAPECGKRYMTMLKAGVRQNVCSCGWKQILTKYPNNYVNPKQIIKR